MVLARVPLAIAFLAAANAHAQCSRQISLVDSLFAQQPITAGMQQNPSSGWIYERGQPGERIMLEGVQSGSWTTGTWASPTQGFYVPLAGPVYSPVPERNQIPYYYRLPSFDGIMLHPNYGSDDARAILVPQQAVTLSSLTVLAEDLGAASGGAFVAARIERVNGSVIPLIVSTSVVSLAPALSLSPAAGLPTTLAPGDRLVVETSSGGDASEDWVNINVNAVLSGPPVIEFQPIALANCGGPTTARLRASGASSFRWSKDNIPLSDGVTPSGSVIQGTASDVLTITDFAPSDVGIYTCVVSNACGSLTSTGATITLCFADFNCDGFLDFFDYDNFVEAFETGDTGADYNRDGFLDFFDYDDFVTAFETGC